MFLQLHPRPSGWGHPPGASRRGCGDRLPVGRGRGGRKERGPGREPAGPRRKRNAKPAAPPAGRALSDRRSGFRRGAGVWAKVAAQSGSRRPVSRSPLQVSLSRCDSGPDGCLSIAALRGRASPSQPRTEPLVSPGPTGSCSAGLLCLSLGNADGAPARGDWSSGHKTAPCFAVTGLPTTGQGSGSRGALAGGEISTSQCFTRSLQW